MVLEKLELTNFRLHKRTSVNFGSRLNYIVGGNGQGKTTILEAIYYLCTTKSLNNNSDIEKISFDEDYFEIEGLFKSLVKNKVRINLLREATRKNTWLDDKPIKKSSSLIGSFPVVTLTQSDHSLTLGSPSERRKFVDSVISQSSETYLKTLIDYNKTLRQRSFLLNKIKEVNDSSMLGQFEAWTEVLIKNGIEIIKHRKEFIRKFNEYVRDVYVKLLDEKEKPDIKYLYLSGNNIDNIEEVFRKKISERRNDELRRCVNLVGPHRDDFMFSINERELKKYGSQGQHKTFQIALKFAQYFFLKDALGKKPVFLMDDVFGELDEFRAKQTSKFLREIGQAFITLTDFTKYKNLVNEETDLVFEIENGALKIGK